MDHYDAIVIGAGVIGGITSPVTAERHSVFALDRSQPYSKYTPVFCGFSGHGFKLSPWVGRGLAQDALGLGTDVSLAPYSLERFRTGRLLTGRYGVGAVS